MTDTSVLLLLLAMANSSLSCTDEERRDMERNPLRCMAQTLAMAKAVAHADEDQRCRTLDRMVNECAEVTVSCHGHLKLRFIQDVQLQGIATFFGQKGIYRKYATCPAMVEYESSNRSAHLATEFCSVDRVKEVSNDSSRCIRHLTEEMESEALSASFMDEAKGAGSLQRAFTCDYYKERLNDCLLLLKECYPLDFFHWLHFASFSVTNELLGNALFELNLEHCRI